MVEGVEIVNGRDVKLVSLDSAGVDVLENDDKVAVLKVENSNAAARPFAAQR